MWKSLILAALPLQAVAQVTGSAFGFARGVTGGGNAVPAIPKDINELRAWLTDSVPRVIMLDKEYNFLNAEGRMTATGCRPSSNTCGSAGQDALDGPNWCGTNPDIQVTYYVSPTKPIDIKSNKSIVGVGNKGVIRGKGFRLVSNAKNIIIQNVHFTDLNPQYIWGGDALQLSGSDMVWIDHCKFSLVGRQMIVTGFESAGRVTISNNEFDGRTNWSASCNGQHYWTLMFVGKGDKITLANNYIHHVSGRSPKVGSDTTMALHVVNNYFADSNGHNFEISAGSNILIEGNVFNNCKAPIAAGPLEGSVFNAPASSVGSCSGSLRRACEANSLSGSGAFPGRTDSAALSAIAAIPNVAVPMPASKVAASVLANAGIGKLKAPTAPAPTTQAPTVPKPTSGTGVAGEWQQCGGQGYAGPTKCAAGLVCKVANSWYSQCLRP